MPRSRKGIQNKKDVNNVFFKIVVIKIIQTVDFNLVLSGTVLLFQVPDIASV